MNNSLLRFYILSVDLSFLVYWISALFDLFPEAWLFKDYYNPIISAWNWSFFPLDMFVSLTGILSFYLVKKGNISTMLLLISLSLTFCAGLMAISFWMLTKSFDLTWWLANLYLVIPSVFFLMHLLKKSLPSNLNTK